MSHRSGMHSPRVRPGRQVPPGCQGRAGRKGSGHPEECEGVSTYCRPRGNPWPGGNRNLRMPGALKPSGQQPYGGQRDLLEGH